MLRKVNNFFRQPKVFPGILHIVLVIIVTLKIVIFNVEDSNYTRSMNKNWLYYFNPYGWNQPNNNVQLFTVNNTVHALESMLETYGKLSNISMAAFSYRHNEGGYCQETPTFIKAETLYWATSDTLNSYSNDIHSPQDLDFITLNTTKYFSTLDTLKLTMWLCNSHAVANPFSLSGRPMMTRCYQWEVQILYRFISQVYIVVEINDRLNGACKGTETIALYEKSHSIWLEIASLVFGGVYFLVACRSIGHARRYYQAVQHAHAKSRMLYLHRNSSSDAGNVTSGSAMDGGDEYLRLDQGDEGQQAMFPLLPSPTDRMESSHRTSPRTMENDHANTYIHALRDSAAAAYEWTDIPWSVKRRFAPVWILLTISAILLCMSDASYRVYYRTEYIPTTPADKLMLGLACMLLWGTLLQFLVFDRRVYGVAMSISVAFPRLVPYIVGVIPVYLAFVFLAISIWGSDLGMFSSFPAATKTLFALMQGDQIHDMLSLMKLKSVSLTALFAVAFMITSLYLIMNIVISIVEEAYFVSKKRRRHLETLIESRLAAMVESLSRESETLPGDLRQQSSSQAPAPSQVALTPDGAEDEDDGIADLLSSLASPTDRSEAAGTLLTPEERAAEVYILGRTHFEYSKMMDYLAQQAVMDSAQGDEDGDAAGRSE